MNRIEAPSQLTPRPEGVCLAIGFFDGVHLGHQQVIRQAMADAEQHESTMVVVTFDRHPNTVVAPDRAPRLIYPLSRKLHVLEQLGVPTTLVFHFDQAFSQQPGDEFVRGLAASLGRVKSICVGSRFTFGHKRSGNVALLKQMGDELGFVVHGLAAVALDGEVVSSTRIREFVRAGDFDAAGQMLGRPYGLSGPVIRGDQLGRQLGVPTANIDVAGLELVPHGVYAAHALVEGQMHRAVLNIGVRPTLKAPEPKVHVEAHLLDLDVELYGKELELRFFAKLRDEQAFPSLDALKQQIQEDIQAAKRCFG